MTSYTNELNRSSTRPQDYSAPTGLSARYNKLVEDLKFSHFALISIAILFGSCLGGIVAMYVMMAGFPIWAVGIGLSVSLANLVACISQAPTKWVVNIFALSIVVNALLFISAITM